MRPQGWPGVARINLGMKRKKPAKALVPATEALIAIPVETVTARPPAKRGKCVICGDEAAPFSEENLCWVCRRLKFSAWKDAENQPTVQE